MLSSRSVCAPPSTKLHCCYQNLECDNLPVFSGNETIQIHGLDLTSLLWPGVVYSLAGVCCELLAANIARSRVRAGDFDARLWN